MNCCLVLAYNEEKYIDNLLTSIENIFDEIVVINDFSSDNTQKILNNSRLKNLTILNNKKNLGAGKSLEIGVQYFLASDHEYLVKVDGDGQFKTDDINKMISLTEKKVDFIKCDRFWENGIEGEIPLVRYIGNSLASLLIKISTGNWKINDPLNGLFLFSKRSLENFKLPKVFKRYGYPFYVNVFMNEKIFSQNIKIFQLKNTVQYRDEESKLRPSIMFIKLMYYTIKSFNKKIIQKFKYSNLQISALLDVLTLVFLTSCIYSAVNLILITFEYIDRPKASWLFLTIIMLVLSVFTFYYSQAYERKVYENCFINYE
jgi:glycosyltransferase involved in cell wall biosynthesis